MKALPRTKTQAAALRARLRTALGLPRVAVESDRVGGGIHVPLAEVVTREAVSYDEAEGVVLVPPELEARLTAGERSALVAPAARDALLDGAEKP